MVTSSMFFFGFAKLVSARIIFMSPFVSGLPEIAGGEENLTTKRERRRVESENEGARSREGHLWL